MLERERDPALRVLWEVVRFDGEARRWIVPGLDGCEVCGEPVIAPGAEENLDVPERLRGLFRPGFIYGDGNVLCDVCREIARLWAREVVEEAARRGYYWPHDEGPVRGTEQETEDTAVQDVVVVRLWEADGQGRTFRVDDALRDLLDRRVMLTEEVDD